MAITRYAGDRFTANTGDTRPTGVLQGAFLINTGNQTSYVKTGNSSIESDWVALQGGGGGGGSPSGDSFTVQFNDGGVFGGDADLTFTDGNRLNVNKLGISGNVYDSNNWIGEGGMILANEGATGVNWKNIESVLSGVGGSGVANYVARWSDEDTLTTGALVDNGTKVGIGITGPLTDLHIAGVSSDPPQGGNWASLSIGDDYWPERRTQINAYRSLRGGDWDHMGISFQPHTSSNHLVGPTITGMVIDYDGNVGIGTNSPSYPLDVEHATTPTVSIVSSAANVSPRLIIDAGGGSGTADPHIKFDSDGVDWSIGTDQSDSDKFKLAASSGLGSAVMTIQRDGNVGIGTTAPGDKLEVVGNILIPNNSYFRGKDTGGTARGLIGKDSSDITTIVTQSAGSVQFKDGSNVNVLINGDGSVGIGTNAPASKLQVSTTDAASVLTIHRDGSNVTTANTSLGRIQFAQDYDAGQQNWGHIDFVTTATSAYRTNIDFHVKSTSGNVMRAMTINGTDGAGPRVGIEVNAPNANLHVGSAAALGSQSNPALQIGGTTYYRLGFYTTAEGAVIENKNGDDGIIFKVKTLGEAMRIDSPNGSVGIGITTPAEALEVYNASEPRIRVTAGTNSNPGYEWAEGATRKWVVYNENSDDNLQFKTNSDVRMVVQQDGNVGIGNNLVDPQRRLHVSGDAIISGVLYDSTNSSGDLGEVLTSEVGGPQWKMIEDVLSGVGGNGTAEYIPRWVDSDTIGNSVIAQSGDAIGIGTVMPAGTFTVKQAGIGTNDAIRIEGTGDANYGTLRVNSNGYTILYAGGASSGGLQNNRHLFLESARNIYLNPTAGTTNVWGNRLHVRDNRYIDFGDAVDYSMGHDTATNNFYIASSTALVTPRISLQSDGNVGIGITNPGAKLDVLGSARFTASSGDPIWIAANQNIKIFASETYNRNLEFNMYDSGTTSYRTVLFLEGATTGKGSVGIGTDAPAYTLDVQGNIGRNSTGTLVIQGGNSASNDYTQTNLVEISASSINPNQPNHGGNARVASIQLLHHDLAGSASSGSIKFYTQATNNVSPYLEERMVIKSDGNVGISGPLHAATQTQTADGSSDITFFGTGTNGNSQSAAYYSRLKIKGGSSQSRDLQLWQENSGYAYIGTSWISNQLHLNNFEGLYLNTANLIINPDKYLYFEGDDDDALNRIGRNSSENAILLTARYHVGILIDSNADDTLSAFTVGHNGTTLATAGTLLRVQSDGNVGIGTTNPGVNLDVVPAAGSGNIRVKGQSTSDASLVFNEVGVGDVGKIGWDGSEGLLKIGKDFSKNGLVVNTTSNKVGIGVALDPQHNLHVSGDAIISGVLYDSINSSGAAGHVFTSEVGGPQWKMIEDVLSGVGGDGTANYVPKWIDSDTIGDSLIYDDATNVGIGTTNPQRLLHVNGDAIVSGKFYDQTNSTGDKGYVLTSDDSGPLWKASGDFDGLSGNLIETGQTLTTDINAVASNLVLTGAFVDTNTLGIATNVTNIATNVTNIATNVTNISTNASNLVLTGAIVDDVSGNLITTGQYLTDEINTVSGLIPPTVVDGAGVTGYTARWYDGNTLTTGTLYDNGTNVGIGTDTPQALLQIGASTSSQTVGEVPTVRIIGPGNSATRKTVLRLNRTGVSSVYYPASVDFNMKSFDASGAPYYGPGTQLDISLKSSNTWSETANVDVMTLRDDGNVGIGTTAPSELLHVEGGNLKVAGTAAVYATTNDGAAASLSATQSGTGRAFQVMRAVASATRQMADFVQAHASGGTEPAVHIQQTTTASDALRITPDGSTAKFAVTGTGALTGTSATFSDDITLTGTRAIKNSTSAGVLTLQGGASWPGGKIVLSGGNAPSTGDIKFYTGLSTGTPAQRLVITNDGNVGIGTTAPAQKLHVEGSILIGGLSATASNYLLFHDTGGQEWYTNYSGSGLQFVESGNAQRVIFKDGGGITVSGGASTFTHAIEVQNGATNDGKVQLSSSASYYLRGGATLGYTRLDGPSVRLYAGGSKILDATTSGVAVTGTGNFSGAVTIGAYTLPNTDGTTGYHLQTDGVGGVTWAAGGAGTVDGSGTANYIPKWTDGDTIGDSIIYDSGSKIGIGTSSQYASEKLSVNGSIFANASNGNGLIISRATVADDESGIIDFRYGTNLYYSASIEAKKLTGGHTDLYFYNGRGAVKNTNPTMTLDSLGNVGIGSTDPGKTLDVVGSGRVSGNLYIGTGGGFFYNDSGSRIRTNHDFYTNNANTYLYGNNLYLGASNGDNVRLRANTFTWTGGSGGIINSSGSVGIGTDAPSDILQVDNTANGGEARVIISNRYQATSSLDETTTLMFGFGNTSSGLVRGAQLEVVKVGDYSTTANRKTKLNITTRDGDDYNGITIDEKGNVGIGIAAPGARLHVVQTGSDEAFRVDGASGGFAMIVKGGSTYNTMIRGGVTIGNTFAASAPPSNGLITEGSVGIGTTSPAYELEVAGTISNYGDGKMIRLRSDDYIIAQMEYRGTGVNYDKGYFRLFDTGVTKVVLDSAGNSYINGGNLGVGIAAPDAPLHVWSNGTANVQETVLCLGSTTSNRPLLQFSEGAGAAISAGMSIEYNGNGAGAANKICINDITGSPKFTVMSGGNVGIGTNTPDTLLHVYDASATPVVRIQGNTGGSSEAQLHLEGYKAAATAGAVGSIIFENHNANEKLGKISVIKNSTSVHDVGDMAFYTHATGGTGDPVERMRILHDGNVGIGTTAPDAGRRLHVKTTGTVPLMVESTTTTAHINYKNSQGSSFLSFENNDWNFSSGRVGVGATAPSAPLHVVANATGYTGIFYNSNAASEGITIRAGNTSSQNSLVVQNYNGTAGLFTVRSDGKVGINKAPNSAVTLSLNAPASNTTNYGLEVCNATSNTRFLVDGVGNTTFYGSDNSISARVTSDGKVGIGTTNPGYALDIRTAAGDVFLKSNTGTNRAGFQSANTGGVSYFYRESSSGGNAITGSLAYATVVGGTGAYPLQLGTNNAIRLTIDSAGKVGIGETVPVGGLVVRTDNVDATASANASQYSLNIHGNGVSDGEEIGLALTAWASGGSLTTGYTPGAAIVHERTGGNSKGHLHFRVKGSTTANAALTTAMTILDSSNVGIGTTAPLNTFQIDSYTVASQGNQTVSAISNVFANSGSDAIYIGIKNAAYPNRGWSFKATTNGVNSDFTIREHGSTGDRLTIKTGGSVGIGTTNPATALDVVGEITGLSSLTNTFIRRTATASGLGNVLSLIHNTSGTPGIGLGARFVMGSESSTTESLTQVMFDTPYTNITHATRTADLVIQIIGSGTLAEKFRITGAGKLKLNTYGSGTHTGTATYKLSVDSSGNVIETAIGAGAVDGSGTTNYVSKWTDGDTIGNSVIRDDGTNVGIGTTGNGYKLRVQGNVYISGTLTEASSLALKENIETYSPSLEMISKIRPVRFNKKKSEKKEVGLVAEELAEMFPELVETDEKGNPSGVNYSRAVAVLLHGFKELYKEVKELKEKI